MTDAWASSAATDLARSEAHPPLPAFGAILRAFDRGAQACRSAWCVRGWLRLPRAFAAGGTMDTSLGGNAAGLSASVRVGGRIDV